MNIQLRQRVLAAIVILALIVIFVPMLFRKHAKDQISSVISFPTAPAKPNVGEATSPVTVQPSSASMSQPSAGEAVQPSTVEMAQTTDQQNVSATQVNQSAPQAVVQPTSIPAATSVSQMQTLQPTTPAVNMPQSSIPAATQPVSTPMPKTTNNAVNKPMTQSDVTVMPADVQPATQKINLRTSSVNSNNVSLPNVTPAQAVRLNMAKQNNQAWVVQLGSFVNNQNAKQLVAKLRKQGFDAFAYKTHQGHIVQYRVYVGPMVAKREAKLAQLSLGNKLHLNSFIVSFNATHFH